MAFKWGKRILALATATAAVAGIVYLLKEKDNCKKDDEFSDDFEDEDFDLDDDFSTSSDREYVSLTPNTSDADAETADVDAETADIDTETADVDVETADVDAESSDSKFN